MSDILNLFKKTKLWRELSLKEPIEENTLTYKNKSSKTLSYKDPAFNLLKEYSQLLKVLKEKDSTKLLYYNMQKVHSILYVENKNFTISTECINTIQFNFYLNLLINNNKGIVNYHIILKYIEDIFIKYKDKIINFFYEKNLNNETNLIHYFIISKILLNLINYYKETEEYEDDDENILIINSTCDDYIKKNENYLKKYDLDKYELISKNIDEIYIKILISLIKNNTFEKFDLIENIMEKLELQEINLTKTMFNELVDFLTESNENIKKFKIDKIYDLKDNNKKNFYYFIFKYIIKNPIYIYYIPFLSKLKKLLLKFIKSNSYKLPFDQDEKITFILTSFLDSNYYINKLNSINESKNTTISQNSYKINNTLLSQNIGDFSNLTSGTNENNSIKEEKNIISQRKNSDRNINNELIESGINFNFYNCCIIIEAKKNKKTFSYKYKEITYKNNDLEDINIQYEELIKIKDKKIKSNYFDKFKKFISFLENISNILKEKSENLTKFEINLKLNFEQNSINKNDITCTYYLSQQDSEIIDFYDDNILSNTFKENIGFTFLIFNIKSNEKIDFSDDDSEEFFKYSNIKFIEIFGKHKESAEFIKKLRNRNYISGSIDHSLYFYDIKDIEKIELNNGYTFYTSSICEINIDSKNKNDTNLIICSKNSLYFIQKNENNYKTICKNIEEIQGKVCFEANNDNFIIVGENGIFMLKNLPSHIFETEINQQIEIVPLINNKYFTNGIKINENIYAFTSDRNKSTGEDKLLFYNLGKKKIINEIKNWHLFSDSLNGLALMDINNQNTNINNKILLCACKKYKSNQKNGILLVNPILNDNDEIYYDFYETNYEVNCFCQLDIDEETNNIKSDYFLVGGYNIEKGIGEIYLYQFYEENFYVKIKLLSVVGYDKHIENFEDFTFINCIIQCEEKEKILISCSDGNIYSFMFNGTDIISE